MLPHLKIPPKVAPGDKLEAAQYNALRDSVIILSKLLGSAMIQSSSDILMKRSHGGTTLKLARRGRGGSSSGPCSLGRIESDENGRYITAGYINGGGVHELVGGPSNPTLVPTVGDHVYIQAAIEADVTDDLLSGGYSISVPVVAQGETVPDDEAITGASPIGLFYIPLGNWADDGDGNPVWQGESCGDVQVVFCVPNSNQGAVSYVRIASIADPFF